MRKLRRPNGDGFVAPERCIYWKKHCCSMDSMLFAVTVYPRGDKALSEYEDALMCSIHREEIEQRYRMASTGQYSVEWKLHTPHVWINEMLAT